jgi:hypothetical protein
MLDEIISLDHFVYCIYNKFNFGAHVHKMRGKHPDWSQRQLECCLYWQGTARKRLKEEIRLFSLVNPEYTVIMCPEACGVNITATMAKLGIHLEWPPVNWTYQVALAGMPKEE